MSDFFVHPQALVETKNIGKGSRIWAFAHILPQAKIGENANICDHTFIENDVVVGNNVTIKSGVYLWDGITIEDDCFVGPSAAFTNDLYPRSQNHDFVLKRIILKKGSSIGANAAVLAGVTIGSYALVGAGSVVTRNMPDFALVYGNPAEVKAYVCVCTLKLQFDSENKAICDCGRTFEKKGETVILS